MPCKTVALKDPCNWTACPHTEPFSGEQIRGMNKTTRTKMREGRPKIDHKPFVVLSDFSSKGMSQALTKIADKM